MWKLISRMQRLPLILQIAYSLKMHSGSELLKLQWISDEILDRITLTIRLLRKTNNMLEMWRQ
jgi:hypothetical protein